MYMCIIIKFVEEQIFPPNAIPQLLGIHRETYRRNKKPQTLVGTDGGGTNVGSSNQTNRYPNLSCFEILKRTIFVCYF